MAELLCPKCGELLRFWDERHHCSGQEKWGCTICHNAMPEGEWCRACGRGLPPAPQPEPQRSPLLEAVRKARGTELTEQEIEQQIGFLNAMSEAMREKGAEDD